MSGGQHRNDEANGPSRSGERETERSRKAREPSTKPATAQIHGCAQENKKLRQNALDGADFVRDVIDIYLETYRLLFEFHDMFAMGRVLLAA